MTWGRKICSGRHGAVSINQVQTFYHFAVLLENSSQQNPNSASDMQAVKSLLLGAFITPFFSEKQTKSVVNGLNSAKDPVSYGRDRKRGLT